MTNAQPTKPNYPALLATLTLIVGGISHFIVVDMAVLHLRASFITWDPVSLIDQLHATTIDMAAIGSNNAYRIVAGMSLWMTLSLVFIGVYNLIVLTTLPAGHRLRRSVLILSLVVAISFFAIATACFIYAAALGGLLAAVLFGAGVRKEYVAFAS